MRLSHRMIVTTLLAFGFISGVVSTLAFMAGTNLALASQNADVVQACVNNSSGEIKIVDTASRCKPNETNLSLVLEAGLLAVKNDIDSQQNQLEAEEAARVAANVDMQNWLKAEEAARVAANVDLQNIIGRIEQRVGLLEGFHSQ